MLKHNNKQQTQLVKFNIYSKVLTLCFKLQPFCLAEKKTAYKLWYEDKKYKSDNNDIYNLYTATYKTIHLNKHLDIQYIDDYQYMLWGIFTE